MQTSAKGLADLKLHEGVVLKAYRCPAGIWTIGAGLTTASGVLKVRPGMVITAAEADRLLAEALRRNFEPRVTAAMAVPGPVRSGRPEQHEFDAGVSFDFNTGAIHRASWVRYWRDRRWDEVERRLKQWTRGGGRVLPGLVRRRQAEYEMLRFGRYASDSARLPRLTSARAARIVLPLSAGELADVVAGFRKLGFDPGAGPDVITDAAVRAFQSHHDLTVDGIIGRATLSTLQRALDVRARAVPAAGATAAAGAVPVADGATAEGLPVLDALPWLAEAILAAAILYGLWLAWRYRDQIAAAVQSRMPRIAAMLRSV